MTALSFLFSATSGGSTVRAQTLNICPDLEEDLFEPPFNSLSSEDLEHAYGVLLDAAACQETPEALFYLGEISSQLGRCHSATQYYQRYINSHERTYRTQALLQHESLLSCSERYEALINQAELAREADDPGKFIEFLSSALSLSAEPAASILYGEALQEYGQCEEAIGYFRGLDTVCFMPFHKDIIQEDLLIFRESCDGCLQMTIECEANSRLQESALSDQNRTIKLTGISLSISGLSLLTAALIHDFGSNDLIDQYNAAIDADDDELSGALRTDISHRRTVSVVLYGSSVITTLIGSSLWIYASAGNNTATEDCDSICLDLSLLTQGSSFAIQLRRNF
jgi:tetratricopeptide (TPR) repeat protein